MSVRDAEGNVATMTSSNGEGSGWVIPGTGVIANNMMGEDDLHPDGLPRVAPGPAGGVDDGAVRGGRALTEPSALVLGSGGSKRIRTALLQVIAGVVDQGRPLAEAVDAPRLHWDGEQLHVEPGWSEDAVEALSARWPLRRWGQRDLYFGGRARRVPRGSRRRSAPRRFDATRLSTSLTLGTTA